MHLLIYETTHFENLPALLELSFSKFDKITVFITRASFEQLAKPASGMFPVSLNFVIQTEAQGNRAFMKALFRYAALQKVTHLHINTLEHNMLFFAAHLLWVGNMEVSMTVHLINDYKTKQFNNLKNCTEAIAKAILYRKVKTYRVLAPAMKPYFEAQFPNKKVVFIPGQFFDANANADSQHASDFFTLVITGTVEEKRRDYPLVAQFLMEQIPLFTKYRRIKLILVGNAGSAYGQQVVNELKQLTNADFLLEWFENDVAQKTYDQLFCEADIVWNPIRVHTKGIRNVPETSSISISPGFITDQMRFGRCGILPTGIKVDAVLGDYNYMYSDSTELKAIFVELLEKPEKLRQRQQDIARACTHFSTTNFENPFTQLINGTASL